MNNERKKKNIDFAHLSNPVVLKALKDSGAGRTNKAICALLRCREKNVKEKTEKLGARDREELYEMGK